MNSFDKEIGNNLRKIRESNKISRMELGKYLGVSWQQIQKYEKGKNRISASSLWKISKFLNAHIDDFLVGGD